MLRAEWGRRGKSMQSQIKGVFASSLGTGEWDAKRAFHSLVGEKTQKGYRIVEEAAV
jgi:predicted DNA-binding WGR domain protein